MIDELIKQLQEDWAFTTEQLNDIRAQMLGYAFSALIDSSVEREVHAAIGVKNEPTLSIAETQQLLGAETPIPVRDALHILELAVKRNEIRVPLNSNDESAVRSAGRWPWPVGCESDE